MLSMLMNGALGKDTCAADLMPLRNILLCRNVMRTYLQIGTSVALYNIEVLCGVNVVL